MTAPAPIDDIRKRIGDRYAVERELGRGGMGAVYLARDLRLDRQVALKVLPPELAADSALRERFLRETRTAASFSHPNIVPVHEVVELGGVIAFAMGYVEGESLSQLVRRAGPFDVRSLVRLLQDIGYALAYAHGRGVVHRDIKPDNIMIERATGRALLMDFGISRAITTTVAAPGLTRVGEVVGTPEYMSPEQASGDQVDGRSDIYSLGLVALFALTGRPVITADSTQKILVKQLTELPPAAAVLREDLPAPLADAIDKCVAKLPAERFATAEALVEVIDSAQLAAPEIPLPVRLFAQEAGTLSLVILFLGVIAYLLLITLTQASGGDNLDATIPTVVLFAIGLTRIIQTGGSARRLATLGFRPSEVLKGMRGVVDEREGLRQQLRVNPDTHRRRRKTLITAGAVFLLGVVVAKIGLSMRVDLGGGRHQSGPAAYWTLATAEALFGAAVLLFVRSPFRTPLAERLFRVVWLGPLGRAFVAASSYGVAPPQGSSSRSSVSAVAVPRVAPVAMPAPAPAVVPAAAVAPVRAAVSGARLHLQIIIVSTREGRLGPKVATWFTERARAHANFDIEVVDLADVNLPLLDEPKHPRFRQYEHAHTKAWSAIVERADAYAFVTPEYDYAPPAALVNALQYLSQEWAHKPVAFVSYGGVSAGTRGVEVSKQLVTALNMMPIPVAVSLPFFAQHINKETGVFEPGDVQAKAASTTLDELLKWSEALKSLRT